MIIQVSVLRLLLRYAARALGIGLLVLFAWLLITGKYSFWGNALLGVISLACIAGILLPENLRIEIQKGKITGFATIWGYQRRKTLEFSGTIFVGVKQYSKSGGIMYGATLWLHTTSGSLDAVDFIAANREVLREKAEQFVQLLMEKTGNKVMLN